jgi:hypothetical protein
VEKQELEKGGMRRISGQKKDPLDLCIGLLTKQEQWPRGMAGMLDTSYQRQSTDVKRKKA